MKLINREARKASPGPRPLSLEKNQLNFTERLDERPVSSPTTTGKTQSTPNSAENAAISSGEELRLYDVYETEKLLDELRAESAELALLSQRLELEKLKRQLSINPGLVQAKLDALYSDGEYIENLLFNEATSVANWKRQPTQIGVVGFQSRMKLNKLKLARQVAVASSFKRSTNSGSNTHSLQCPTGSVDEPYVFVEPPLEQFPLPQPTYVPPPMVEVCDERTGEICKRMPTSHELFEPYKGLLRTFSDYHRYTSKPKLVKISGKDHLCLFQALSYYVCASECKAEFFKSECNAFVPYYSTVMGRRVQPLGHLELATEDHVCIMAILLDLDIIVYAGESIHSVFKSSGKHQAHLEYSHNHFDLWVGRRYVDTWPLDDYVTIHAGGRERITHRRVDSHLNPLAFLNGLNAPRYRKWKKHVIQAFLHRGTELVGPLANFPSFGRTELKSFLIVEGRSRQMVLQHISLTLEGAGQSNPIATFNRAAADVSFASRTSQHTAEEVAVVAAKAGRLIETTMRTAEGYQQWVHKFVTTMDMFWLVPFFVSNDMVLKVQALSNFISHPMLVESLGSHAIQGLKVVLFAMTSGTSIVTPMRSIVPEALMDSEHVKRLQKLDQSDLGVKLNVFMNAVVSASFLKQLPLAVQMIVKAWSESVSSIGSTATAAFSGMDLVESVLDRVVRFRETGDIIDLIGLPKKEQKMREMEELLKKMQDFRRVRNGLDINDLILEAKALVASCDGVSTDPLFIRLKTELYMEARILGNTLNTQRDFPFGIIISGDTGTGKTQLVNNLTDIVQRDLDIPDCYDIKHDITTTKHQSLPAFAAVLHFSDQFQVKEEFMQTSILEVLQTAVDTAALKLETASIEEKARSSIAPVLVAVTTNANKYSMVKATGGLSKLNRRYIGLKMNFKAEAKAHAQKHHLTNNELHKFKRVVNYTLYKFNFPDEGNELDLSVDKGFELFNSDDKDAVLEKIHALMQDSKHNNQPLPKTIFGEDGKAKTNCDDLPEIPLVPEGAQISLNRPDSIVPYHNMIVYMTCEHYPAYVGTFVYRKELPAGQRFVPAIWQYHPRETVYLMQRICPRRWKIIEIKEPEYEHPLDTFKNWLNGWRTSYWEMLHEYFPALAEIEGPESIVDALKVVAIFGAITASSIYALKAIFNVLRVAIEGTLHNGVVQVPVAYTPVAPSAATDSFHLGSPSAATVVTVTRMTSGGPYTMRGIMITPTLFHTADHFFVGNADKPEWTPIEEGDTFTVSANNVGAEFKFEKFRHISRVGDSGWYALPMAIGNIKTAFGMLSDTDQIDGHEGSFNAQRIKFKERGAIVQSKPGDCGIPYYSSTKGLVGVHIGKYPHNSVGAFTALTVGIAKGVMAKFKEKGIRLAPVSDELSPIMMEAIDVKSKPGLHPRSEAHWMRGELGLAGHIPVSHFDYADVPRMTGHATSLREKFTVEECPKHHPPSVRAIEVDGVWKGAVPKRIESMRSAQGYDMAVLEIAMQKSLDDTPVAPIPLAPLTLHQALCGDAGNVLIKAKDLSKAVGPTLAQAGVTKKNAFELYGDKHSAHPLVLTEIDRIHNSLKEGVVPMSYVKATIKDELYSEEQKGKARFFYVGDLAVNMVARMYLLPLLVHLLSHPYETAVFGTLNAGSEEWKTLHTFITKFGKDRLVELDQKAYDLKHSLMLEQYAQYMARLALKLGYSEEDAHMVFLVVQMLNRYVLNMEGNIFRCGWGLVSGRCDTLVANCVISKISIYYAYLRSGAGDPQKDLALSNTGDDNLTNICRESCFKPQDLVKYQAELGYELTNAAKGAEIAFRNISEVTYLKRRFLEENHHVYAPLDFKSVLKSLCYTTSCANEHERNGAALNCATRELFLHRRGVWDVYFPRFEAIAKENGYPQLPQWDSLQKEYDSNLFQVWDSNSEIAPVLSGFVGEGVCLADHQKLCLESGSSKLNVFKANNEARGLERPVQVLLSAKNNNNNFNFEMSSVTAEVPSQGAIGLNEAAINVAKDLQTNIVDLRVANVETLDFGSDVYNAAPQIPDLEYKELFARTRSLGKMVMTGTAMTMYIQPLLFANLQLKGILKGYTYYRGDFNVKVQVVGSAGLYGAYRCQFVPVLTKTSYDWGATKDPLTSLDNYSETIPYFDIDLSAPTSYEIKLPFISCLPMLSIVNANPWIIKCNPLSPILSAYGLTPPNVTMEVFCSMSNVELFVPKIVSEGAIDSVPTPPLAKMLGFASELARMSTIPYSSVISKALGIGAKVSEMVGWSKPPVTPGSVVVAYERANLSLCSGQPDFAYVQGSVPGQSRSLDLSLYPLAKEDDDDIDKIVHTYGLLKQSWTTSDAISLCPTTCKFTTAAGINTFNTTPMGHASLAFNLWRGNLRVKIKWFSSPLIRARVGVNIFPPTWAGSFVVTDGTVPFYTIDVIGTTEIEIEVPYFYSSYWRDVPALGAFADMPRVCWYVMDGPFGPTATAPTLYATVWLSAGENFELAQPSISALLTYATDPSLLPPAAAGLTGEDEFVPEGLGAGMFGEVFTNVRYLAKRSGVYGSITSDRFITADGTDRTDSVNWTFDTWFRPAFLGYSGSTTWRVVSSTPFTVSFIGSDKFLTTTPFSSGIGDVRLVDFCPQMFKNPRMGPPYTFVSPYNMLVAGATGTLYQAAGDDRMYHKYYSAPTLYSRT